jgi:putative spermidine/putrescine transport system ATP-binding protein
MSLEEKRSLSSGPAISLVGLTKSFGSVTAVANLDLEIKEGEFFSMLGPSGSGKTTVLRMIAGFEQPTSGTIFLQGENVTDKAPFDRDVNTVFQDYALFPHMTVLENVAYGLRVRGVGKLERNKLASEALETVRLGDYGSRKPSELSGGQRQRVALARAVVVKPKVLLLDEPLGALDLKLREQMQVELKALQRSLGITFIFVTHDQEEALTLSDRVAVFNNGKIEQLGTPRDLYDHPKSEFVARFVGSSNLFTDEESKTLFGKSGMHSMRPEKLDLQLSSGEGFLEGQIEETIYLGAATRVLVQLNSGKRLTVLQQTTSGDSVDLSRGKKVWVRLDANDLVKLGA